MVEKPRLLAVCLSRVPLLSAYAYQRSVSLLLAELKILSGKSGLRFLLPVTGWCTHEAISARLRAQETP